MAANPHVTPEQIDEFLLRRTPLGWGPPINEGGHVLQSRPRRDPGLEWLDDRDCASAYGDSFTAGSGTADDDTYPHELGSILGCRVSNYGVGGYGSDQAFMLWRAQRHLDTAPVVVLGHLSENILRNVNQYRNLLYPGRELFFKPRFVQDDGALVEVPVPIRTAQDFQQLESDPASVLRHEAFLDRPRRAFPYTLALARWLVADFHVRSQLAGVPRHEAFYRSNHPSQALQLTARLLTAFASEAGANGQTPYVVLIPMGDDFVYAVRTNRWPDQPLAAALREAGVSVIHAGPPMLAWVWGILATSVLLVATHHIALRLHGTTVARISLVVLHVVVLTCATALPLAWWGARNHALFGVFTLATNTGRNLFLGNHAGASGGYPVQGEAPFGLVSVRGLNEAAQWLLHERSYPAWFKYRIYATSQLSYLLLLVLVSLRLLSFAHRRERPQGLQWTGWIVGATLPWMIIEASVILVRLAGFPAKPGEVANDL